MARRSRTARRRYDPMDFLSSDGWNKYILDGTPLLPSLVAAQEAWEECRPATWRLWLEAGYSWPPAGAVAHDDIGSLASVDDFRRRRPRAAQQIAEALEVYEAQIRGRLDAAAAKAATEAAATEAGA